MGGGTWGSLCVWKVPERTENKQIMTQSLVSYHCFETIEDFKPFSPGSEHPQPSAPVLVIMTETFLRSLANQFSQRSLKPIRTDNEISLRSASAESALGRGLAARKG